MTQVRDRSTARRLTAPLAVLLAVLLLGACSDAPTPEEIALADDGLDPSIVSIFTAEELLPTVQQLGTLFLVHHAGTTFQYTAKPSDELTQRVSEGVRPAVWIDRSEVLAAVARDGMTTGPAQPVGVDPMQFVVYEEYVGPTPTLEDFGPGTSPVRTGLCDVAVPCGRGARQVLEQAGITPEPDQVFETGRAVVGALDRNEINASLLYRTDAASLRSKFDFVPLPDPTVALLTYQSVALSDNAVAHEFQTWIATSKEAENILIRQGLLSRSGRGA